MPPRNTAAQFVYRFLALAVVVVAGAAASLGQSPAPEFISLDAARPVLTQMANALPPALKTSAPLDQKTWDAWVRAEDSEIRKRLERGEEDTLTNLLRFGVTYTKEYRIDREYLTHFGHSTLVDAFADTRANDLVRALSSPSSNPGWQEMRSFLERKGYSFATAAERARVKQYLLANLARMRDEFQAYREKIKKGGDSALPELYAERGISLDTNLWPDYDLERQLRSLLADGALQPGSIRRMAVVGPGLDFANKEAGNDYYPPQTTQPFALMDSLLRLRLADPTKLQVVTFDISPLVNIHLARVQKEGAAGKAQTVQLPWSTTVPREKQYLAGFIEYWKALGDQIGAEVRPIPPPAATAGELRLRAVKIRPEIAARVTPIDMNIVFQRQALPADQQFDLVVGTNIFLYYDAFEQSLARANLAAMVRPGGFVLTDDALAENVPAGLKLFARTSITISSEPLITQVIYSYRREP
ncbi:MAG TPA: hypothetical protein VF758_08915 [Candidatus Acidoferrum sp.]